MAVDTFDEIVADPLQDLERLHNYHYLFGANHAMVFDKRRSHLLFANTFSRQVYRQYLGYGYLPSYFGRYLQPIFILARKKVQQVR